MSKEAQKVEEYIASLPAERQEAIRSVRETILAYLPEGYEEGIQFGMIGYYVPLEIFSNTYNGKPLLYAAIANQKHHMALYLMCEYMDDARKARFQQKLEAAGKKVDMGKSCVRFRSLSDLPLDIIGKTIASVSPKEFIAYYKNIRGEHT